MGYYVDRLSKVMQANLGDFTSDSSELTAAASELDSSAQKLRQIMKLDTMFGGTTDVAIRSSLDKLSNYIDLLQATALKGSTLTDEMQGHMQTAQHDYQNLPSGGVNFFEFVYGMLPLVWTPSTGLTSGASFLEGLRARREQERERIAREALRRLHSNMDGSSNQMNAKAIRELLLDGSGDNSSSPHFTDYSGVPSGEPELYTPSTNVPPVSEWPIKVYRPGEMSQDGPLDSGYALTLDPRNGVAPRDPVIRDLAEQEMRRQLAGGAMLGGAGIGALGLGAAALGGRGAAALVPNAALPAMPGAGAPGGVGRAGGVGMMPMAGGAAGSAAAGTAGRGGAAGGRGAGFVGGFGAGAGAGSGAGRGVNAPGVRGAGVAAVPAGRGVGATGASGATGAAGAAGARGGAGAGMGRGPGMMPMVGGGAAGNGAGASGQRNSGGRGAGARGGAAMVKGGAAGAAGSGGARGLGAGGGAGVAGAGTGRGAGAAGAGAGAGAARGAGAVGAAGAGRAGMGMVPFAGAGAAGSAKGGRDERNNRRRNNFGASGVEFYEAPEQVEVGAAGEAGSVTDRVIEVAAPEGDRW
ncbi:hypothetical protein [Gulosibacter hominis]|uniref:hypothetical protein n=1 Tax=Gulosibacter hominis TaxID=2770504 RepID=UPI00191AE29F|nr:hypothetical protein [Gulosibacter hominis]